MGLHDLLALLIGSLTLATAVMVVLSRNPIYAAIYLLLTLLGVAAEYVLLSAHFLAIIQVLVYAGAVVVLIVFVLMMLGFGRDQIKGFHLSGPALILPLVMGAVLLAAGGVGLLQGKPLRAGPIAKISVKASSAKKAGLKAKTQEFGSIDAVGRHLISHNLISFEVISVLLLMAIVGVIMLLRNREDEEAELGAAGQGRAGGK